MPRPGMYDTDLLLDTAARIVGSSGAAALSIKEVIRTSGAPSGSVYHRFPNKAALSGALWIRTIERFHAGLLPLLAAGDPTEACVAAARYVISWSRDHSDEAHVLLAGRNAYTPDQWSAELTGRQTELASGLRTAITTVARHLGPVEHATERVTIAVVDLPYAIVRRYLSAETEIPHHIENLVATSARAVIDAPNVA